jgi:hypothetical protein
MLCIDNHVYYPLFVSLCKKFAHLSNIVLSCILFLDPTQPLKSSKNSIS